MTTLKRLHIVAAGQHWLLTWTQLIAAGFTPAAISHLVRTGRLHRIHRGVYAVGRPDLPPLGRLAAGALAYAPVGAVSRRSGGVVWGIVERAPAAVEVNVPTDDHRRPVRGVLLHRTATMTPEDVTVHRNVPVTTLPRTLLDLAGVLTPRGLQDALRQAERLHGLDLLELRAAVELPRRSHRHARLRRQLDLFVPGALVGVGLETAFLALCVRYGVPLPLTQLALGVYTLDFAWPAERLAVETDDLASHNTRTGRRHDRVKDRAVRAAGWDLLRFGSDEIGASPKAVALEVLAALDRRRHELGVGADAGAGPA